MNGDTLYRVFLVSEKRRSSQMQIILLAKCEHLQTIFETQEIFSFFVASYCIDEFFEMREMTRIGYPLFSLSVSKKILMIGRNIFFAFPIKHRDLELISSICIIAILILKLKHIRSRDIVDDVLESFVS